MRVRTTRPRRPFTAGVEAVAAPLSIIEARRWPHPRKETQIQLISMPGITDSHCHLHFPQLASNLDAALANMRHAGVDRALCISVTPAEAPLLIDLAHAHPELLASAGLHPVHQWEREPGVEDLIALGADAKVVAIGETGLDFFRTDRAPPREVQELRLKNHIEAAKELKKPLVIHTRDSLDETLDLLERERAAEVGGVLHCYTGGWEDAQRGLALGFYISFSGILTFRNAADLRDVAAKVPEDRLLVETDAPYLAPVPHRGKTNEPAFVRFVVEELARVRQATPEHMAAVTAANFDTLFNSSR